MSDVGSGAKSLTVGAAINRNPTKHSLGVK